jgi:hypothetical protein
MTNDLKDEFMQYLMDELNKSYSQFKKDHPAFAKIVEEQLEGKTDAEFEAQFVRNPNTHCQGCGEWLQGFDTCDQCGRINK